MWFLLMIIRLTSYVEVLDKWVRDNYSTLRNYSIYSKIWCCGGCGVLCQLIVMNINKLVSGNCITSQESINNSGVFMLEADVMKRGKVM